MKRTFSLVIFFFLVFPYLGIFGWIYIQKQIIRKEVKHKLISNLNKEELAILKFSKAEVNTKLKWEHSKEFEYNSQMYDVVYKTSTHDSIYYYCWEDSKETVLNNKLETLLAEAFEEGGEEKKKNKILISFYKSLYHEELTDFHLSFLATDISYFEWSKNYLAPPISQSGPPPEFI